MAFPTKPHTYVQKVSFFAIPFLCAALNRITFFLFASRLFAREFFRYALFSSAFSTMPRLEMIFNAVYATAHARGEVNQLSHIHQLRDFLETRERNTLQHSRIAARICRPEQTVGYASKHSIQPESAPAFLFLKHPLVIKFTLFRTKLKFTLRKGENKQN